MLVLRTFEEIPGLLGVALCLPSSAEYPMEYKTEFRDGVGRLHVDGHLIFPVLRQWSCTVIAYMCTCRKRRSATPATIVFEKRSICIMYDGDRLSHFSLREGGVDCRLHHRPICAVGRHLPRQSRRNQPH